MGYKLELRPSKVVHGVDDGMQAGLTTPVGSGGDYVGGHENELRGHVPVAVMCMTFLVRTLPPSFYILVRR